MTEPEKVKQAAWMNNQPAVILNVQRQPGANIITMAALLGGLPLALGTGYGSELRRPLGIAIVGDLIVSQMLTLFTTPVIYLYMERLRLGFERLRGRIRHRPASPGTARA